MVTRAEKPEQVLYAHWEIRVCRSVERLSDYTKAKAHLLRSLPDDLGANSRRGRMRLRWFLVPNNYSTAVIAIGTVALVLLTVAMLIVMLL